MLFWQVIITLPMSFEIPSQEQAKSELEQLNAEIEATINEIRATDPEAPEMEWLKEKLKGLDKRLSTHEKPELRTPEHYGKAPTGVPQDVIEMERRMLEDEAKKRKAS